MEITSFILGVCAVIVLMMVVGTLVNYMTTTSLKKEIIGLQREIENLYRDLETKERQLYDFGNNLNQSRVDEEEKLYRHIDSRVDKTVDNTSKHLSDIYRQIDDVRNDLFSELDKLNNKSIING